MKNINLPADSQLEVRTYLITTQGTHHEQEELKSFLEMMSPSLVIQVSIEIFSKKIKMNTRLLNFIDNLARKQVQSKMEVMRPGQTQSSMEEKMKKSILDAIVKRMVTQLAEPDIVVVEQFQEGEAMYLIAKGECEVMVGDESEKKKGESPKLLRPGQYFGEISLVYNCKSTAKVFAKKYCTLAKLSKENFKEVTT